ncbi:MAG: DNA repair protein RecN [Acidiferrobacterales bacterium]
MLTHLYIRDFTIVTRLELSLGRGFTVLTGETGAGKSILIDALTFALGQRADSNVIRDGCQRAEIAASFDLAPEQDAAVWLSEHDLFGDRECMVRRILELDKPSKGFINGRPVPMQMLRELGERLVDVHGQHEHQSVLRRDGQRHILDDYAQLHETITVLERHYDTLRNQQVRRDTLTRQAADRAARVELLRYQTRELEALNLMAGEYSQLEEEHARLANGAELLVGVQGLAQMLYDDETQSVSQSVSHAVAKLEQLSQYDAKLGELASLVSDALIQVDEAASQLHQYADRLELDPQRFDWVDQRLGTLHDLARKHQVPPGELPALLQRLSDELHDLEDFDANLEKLEDGIKTAQKGYQDVAKTVTKKRRAAAARLSAVVTEQMQGLGMAGGEFAARLHSLPKDELSPTGRERVEFLVSANLGQPLRPMNRVASGGELSRISLALQVVVAETGRIPTLIFDEVDVGIGGKVAEIVGQKLRALGRSREVLCITHLAQVAAQGDQHLLASKHTNNAQTVTDVRQLSEEQRVGEIARMIGGLKISTQTLAHAQDMLARAVNGNRVSA